MDNFKKRIAYFLEKQLYFLYIIIAKIYFCYYKFRKRKFIVRKRYKDRRPDVWVILKVECFERRVTYKLNGKEEVFNYKI